jgi:uncharacterized protein (DUF1778 family)
MKSDTRQKIERLDFRVTAEFKKLVTRAASLSGTNITAYMVEAVRACATKTIEQHERLVLNNAARDQFLEALANPPAPNKALQKAAKRYAST